MMLQPHNILFFIQCSIQLLVFLYFYITEVDTVKEKRIEEERSLDCATFLFFFKIMKKTKEKRMIFTTRFL